MSNKRPLRRKMSLPPAHELACLFQQFVQWPERFASKRERLYPPQETFWLFLGQVLCTGTSCQEAVSRFLSRLALCGQQASASSAAYCKARRRLPQEALDVVFQDLAAKTLARAPRESQWGGRTVKVVDGSSVSMPDTARNQSAYPQPVVQKMGCGFPVMRFVVLFSLSTGAVLNYAKGALAVHERTLFHDLWAWLERGDIVLADRGFCSFADYCVLLERGIDCVMRKQARRGKSSVMEKKLGKDDLVMRWNKNNARPAWLSETQWSALPQTMLVREITFTASTPGFRTTTITLATTLLDAKAYPARAFEQLYARRWNAELYLRDLKTTMGMEVLRCKSPEMIDKELTMHFIAYNLLRTAMLQAVPAAKRISHALGFKACLATIRQWAPHFSPMYTQPRKRAALYRALLDTIAKTKVLYRPGRTEPRARKRRPKEYALLNKPRKEFQDIPHRNKYNIP